MRKLLATTAIVALTATGVFAQTTTQPAEPTQPAPATQPSVTQDPGKLVELNNGHLASSLIGETVYDGVGNDAKNIGDVNDVVIGPDGKVQSIVIGVGGFLGIGEKDVAVDYSTLKWAERTGDRWIVVETTAEQLKAQPEFDEAPFLPAPAVKVSDGATPPAATPAPADQTAAAPAPVDAAKPAKETAQAPAADEAKPAEAQDATSTAAVDKSTLKPLEVGAIKAEEFVGTTVYGADDANVGEIGDVILGADQKVDAVIMDVGGFLGMGEKPVAVGMDNLTFMTDENGKRYLYTAFTKEQLDAAPAYDEAAYAEKRDEMRIVVPN
jgi:sporulation protein YlmC with PRC-barrel domain